MKNYINNCIICKTKNKSLILSQPRNQIICSYPKEFYVIDLTELPAIYLGCIKTKVYLLSVIYHFSKLGDNYIIYNKAIK